MSTQTKTGIFATIAFLLFVFIAWSFYPQNDEPSDFDSCVASGFPVLESFPRQCRTESGKIFTEDLSRFEKMMSGASTSSPVSTSTGNQKAGSQSEESTVETTSVGF